MKHGEISENVAAHAASSAAANASTKLSEQISQLMKEMPNNKNTNINVTLLGFPQGDLFDDIKGLHSGRNGKGQAVESFDSEHSPIKKDANGNIIKGENAGKGEGSAKGENSNKGVSVDSMEGKVHQKPSEEVKDTADGKVTIVRDENGNVIKKLFTESPPKGKNPNESWSQLSGENQGHRSDPFRQFNRNPLIDWNPGTPPDRLVPIQPQIVPEIILIDGAAHKKAI